MSAASAPCAGELDRKLAIVRGLLQCKEESKEEEEIQCKEEDAGLPRSTPKRRRSTVQADSTPPKKTKKSGKSGWAAYREKTGIVHASRIPDRPS